ncbi:MAG: hypothetical protein H0T42_08155 [Deltaproteobacteria bacterium]|nr:hypothetical protein [Deltaproteobacteria bacterium]
MKLIGERRALAAAVFAFYFLVYTLLLLAGFVAPDAGPMITGIAGVYGLAFFSLVAGYFWARWYSIGVGLYGVITGIVGLWQASKDPNLEDMIPILIFIGGTHLAATLMLWGNTMAGPYDGQTAWREKLHMDDNAVQRLGRSVIRAGVSLPLVLIYALAPKPETASLVMSIIGLLLAGLGVRALVKAKTWGVLAMGASGALMLTLAAAEMFWGSHSVRVLYPALGGGLMLAATAPFFAPMARWLWAPR